jgi:hypothetical protein
MARWNMSLACSGGTLPLLLACNAPGSAAPSTDSVQMATCADPGDADPGPPDDHCATAGPDGGALVTTVDQALCTAVPDDDAGPDGGCTYLPTRFGHEADDDDCKYHFVWSSTPICEAPGSVFFTVVATSKLDGKPLTGAQPIAEVFTTTPGDWDASTYCDDMSTTPGNSGTFTESPPGTYVGPIEFTRGGQWTVRFHFFPNCNHWVDSPHGHAAFHVAVP